MSRFAPLTLLPLLACGETEPHEDPAEHACDHVTEAGVAVDAGADLDSAGQISVSEEPFTVSLIDGAPGFVSVEVDQHVDVLVFLDLADVAASAWVNGEDVGLPAPAPNELCGEDIPEHYELELDAGSWALELGPAAVDEVWLMVTEAEGHAH